MSSAALARKIKASAPFKRTRDESSDESASQSDFKEGSSQDGLSDNEEDEEAEDADSDDADAPRIAQWEADDDDLYDKIDEQPQGKPSNLSKLENNLHGLPLGTLRKAQKALKQVEAEVDSESDSESGSDSAPEDEPVERKPKREKVEWISRDIKKHARSSKHAPMEVTSKKPVTRKRTAVEVPKLVERDPRFLPTAGEFKPEHFQKSYGFLADSRKDELKVLRENLARSQKQLSSYPFDLRYEREQEIQGMERAIKRIEGLVNKDRQDAIQQRAMQKMKAEEKEKQKQGKGKWFLKESDKRQIVQKARFEALSSEGGHRAVKKAIERKQKKTSQKEKKSRPYARGAGLEESGSKRRAIPFGGQGPNKRQRFS